MGFHRNYITNINNNSTLKLNIMNISELNQLLDQTETNETFDFIDDAYLVEQYEAELKRGKND
jgi:hypothetical protein